MLIPASPQTVLFPDAPQTHDDLVELVVVDLVDPHGHLRKDNMARLVTPFSTAYCSHFLPMPNVPRLITLQQLIANTDALQLIIEENGHDCELMLCVMIDQVTDAPTTIEIVREVCRYARSVGKRAHFKIYFVGTTTGATGSHAAGVVDIYKLLDIFKCIRDEGGIVLGHFEKPKPYFQSRESEAVEWFWWIVNAVDKLPLVVEHITTPEMIRAVMDAPPWVRANVTPQHPYDTLDIVLSTNANVHNNMKPPHGTPSMQTGLLLTICSLLEKFGFGSDTAPHTREDKHAHGPCGCFVAPFAPLMIIELLCKYLPPYMVQYVLQEFMSNRAKRFYGLKDKGKVVKFVKKPFTIPAVYEGHGVQVVPYRAGHTLQWSYAA